MAPGVKAQNADGVVVRGPAPPVGVLAVGARGIVRGLQPAPPGSLGLGGQQAGRVEPLLQGKGAGPLAHQNDVGRGLHHPAGDRDGMDDILQRADRAHVAAPVHDDGIEGNVTLPVRKAADADRGIGDIGLGHPGSGLDHVEGRAVRLPHRMGGGIGRDAEIPGRDQHGRGRIGLRDPGGDRPRCRPGQNGPARRAAHINPSCLKLATPLRPTIRWSCTSTPRARAASTT